MKITQQILFVSTIIFFMTSCGGEKISEPPPTLVSAGEILMTIDARDAVQQFNAGTAQVESARTKLNLAKSNLERYEQFFQEDAISAATLDKYSRK